MILENWWIPVLIIILALILGSAIIGIVNCTTPKTEESSLPEFEAIPTKDGTRKFSVILSRSQFHDITHNM